MHRFLSELCLVPLVELSETILLIALPLHFILLFLQLLVQRLDNLVELFDFLGIFVTTSGLSILLVPYERGRVVRGTGSPLVWLNVGSVKVLPLPHHLLDLAPVLLILHLLHVQLALDAEKLPRLVLHGLLQLGMILHQTLLLPVEYVSHLPSLLVLGLQCHHYVLVLGPQVTNDKLLLLEALLDHADLLRVREGVLRPDDLLELRPEPCALIHVQLHLHLDLCELS